MKRQKGFTLIELLVVIAIISILASMLFPAIRAAWRDAQKTRCVNRLRQLGQALTLYVKTCGDNRFYPYFGTGGRNGTLGAGWSDSGALFLVACYWAGMVPNADLLICTSTADGNSGGEFTGYTGDTPNYWAGATAIEPNECSYASLKGQTADDGTTPVPWTLGNIGPNDIIACDDTDDPENHEGGKIVLRADGSVFWNQEEEGKGELTHAPYGDGTKTNLAD